MAEKRLPKTAAARRKLETTKSFSTRRPSRATREVCDKDAVLVKMALIDYLRFCACDRAIENLGGLREYGGNLFQIWYERITAESEDWNMSTVFTSSVKLFPVPFVRLL